MKIFGDAMEGEEMDKINYDQTVLQLEPMPITSNQWGVHPWATSRDTWFVVHYKYFEYLNNKQIAQAKI